MGGRTVEARFLTKRFPTRVAVDLTWGEIGALLGLLEMEIEDIERAYSLGKISDPKGLLRTLKRTKAKLDHLTEQMGLVAEWADV